MIDDISSSRFRQFSTIDISLRGASAVILLRYAYALIFLLRDVVDMICHAPCLLTFAYYLLFMLLADYANGCRRCAIRFTPLRRHYAIISPLPITPLR